MIHTSIPDQDAETVTLESLLAEALDGPDLVRLALLTRLCILTADADRNADLDRMRAEGLPQVFRA